MRFNKNIKGIFPYIISIWFEEGISWKIWLKSAVHLMYSSLVLFCGTLFAFLIHYLINAIINSMFLKGNDKFQQIKIIYSLTNVCEEYDWAGQNIDVHHQFNHMIYGSGYSHKFVENSLNSLNHTTMNIKKKCQEANWHANYARVMDSICKMKFMNENSVSCYK